MVGFEQPEELAGRNDLRELIRPRKVFDVLRHDVVSFGGHRAFVNAVIFLVRGELQPARDLTLIAADPSRRRTLATRRLSRYWRRSYVNTRSYSRLPQP